MWPSRDYLKGTGLLSLSVPDVGPSSFRRGVCEEHWVIMLRKRVETDFWASLIILDWHWGVYLSLFILYLTLFPLFQPYLALNYYLGNILFDYFLAQLARKPNLYIFYVLRHFYIFQVVRPEINGLVADIETMNNKMAAEGNFLNTYCVFMSSQCLRSHPLWLWVSFSLGFVLFLGFYQFSIGKLVDFRQFRS